MWDKHLGGSEIGLDIGRSGYDPERPSLLMVHGSGGRASSWLAQLSGLGPGLNAAAIDLPGHGNTPGPGMNAMEDYAGWLIDFIAAGPIRPVLMGHSLGGGIALALALKRPELISGLILVGSGCRLKVMPAVLEGMLANFEDTVKMTLKYAYADNANPRTVEQGIEHMLTNKPEVVLGDFSACDGFDACARLGEIQTPTLILVGEQDKLTPPKYGQFLWDGITGAKMLVIEEAGHMVFIEQHQAFNRAVLEFMSIP